MERRKCAKCGLVNKNEDENCRRCGFSLDEPSPALPAGDEYADKRSLVKRLIWILVTTTLVLFLSYLSLLLTSNELDYEKRQTVEKAIGLLTARGFNKQAFVLGRLATFRGTDNWWNRWIGHRDAYAAVNFPFEVVTLYPEFFQDSVDDLERAAMLLHESYHLLGSGEAAALEGVWREKHQLGWTAKQYSQSRVWNNTRDLTMAQVPSLFMCGIEGKSDCTEQP